MLDLVDYGGGNVGSIRRCLERLKLDYQLVSAQQHPTGRNPIILPGVGAFGAMMQALQPEGLASTLTELFKQGVPCLGICVGLQVLFEGSEEAPGITGLGVLKGQIVKFKADIPPTQALPPQGGAELRLKIPQIGWNRIEPRQTDARQSGWPSGEVYFVNSYYAVPVDPSVTLYQAEYGGQFCAAVRYQNLTAFQFHPEKSGAFGHQLIQRWVDGLSQSGGTQ